MKKVNFLLSGLVSTTLLLTSVLTAQNCVNGHCQVDLKNLAPAKNTTMVINKFKNTDFFVKQKLNTEEVCKIEQNTNSTLFAFDHSKYVQQENEILIPLEEIEDSTIVLHPSAYIMTEAEIIAYKIEEARIKEEIELALATTLAKELEEISVETILNKNDLPTSDRYCEIPKKAIYTADNSFECV